MSSIGEEIAAALVGADGHSRRVYEGYRRWGIMERAIAKMDPEQQERWLQYLSTYRKEHGRGSNENAWVGFCNTEDIPTGF